jgi:hypothetical protein
MSILVGKRHQGRRAAKDDENPMRVAVDRHREIRSHAFCRKRSIGLCREVHDLDLAGIRNIGEDLGPGFVDLESLGMALETDICGLGSACRIDHRKGARAVTHEHLIVLRVHPYVVRILA